MILVTLFLLTGVLIYVFGSTHPSNDNDITTIPSLILTTPPPAIARPIHAAPSPSEIFEHKNQSILRLDSPLLSHEGMYQIHFIHIPKCGGTSMTTVLREMMCSIDPIHNVDCCTNPGFCDYQSGRKCSVIKGCINHFPNR